MYPQIQAVFPMGSHELLQQKNNLSQVLEQLRKITLLQKPRVTQMSVYSINTSQKFKILRS